MLNYLSVSLLLPLLTVLLRTVIVFSSVQLCTDVSNADICYDYDSLKTQLCEQQYCCAVPFTADSLSFDLTVCPTIVLNPSETQLKSSVQCIYETQTDIYYLSKIHNFSQVYLQHKKTHFFFKQSLLSFLKKGFIYTYKSRRESGYFEDNIVTLYLNLCQTPKIASQSDYYSVNDYISRSAIFCAHIGSSDNVLCTGLNTHIYTYMSYNMSIYVCRDRIHV